MTHAKLNQNNEAKKWLLKLFPPKDAPWEETTLSELLRTEIQMSLGSPLPKMGASETKP